MHEPKRAKAEVPRRRRGLVLLANVTYRFTVGAMYWRVITSSNQTISQ